MTQRELYISELEHCLGAPYLWGGDGTNGGYDCSGLVLHCLGATGKKIPDMTAAMLYEYYHSFKVLMPAAPVGSLVFYWASGENKISHVMSVYKVWKNGERVLAGARGGSVGTRTINDATIQNAFVDLVLASKYIPHKIAVVVDPFREV